MFVSPRGVWSATVALTEACAPLANQSPFGRILPSEKSRPVRTCLFRQTKEWRQAAEPAYRDGGQQQACREVRRVYSAKLFELTLCHELLHGPHLSALRLSKVCETWFAIGTGWAVQSLHSKKTWASCIVQYPGLIYWRWLISNHQILCGYVIQLTRDSLSPARNKAHEINRYKTFFLCVQLYVKIHTFLFVLHKLSII